MNIAEREYAIMLDGKIVGMISLWDAGVLRGILQSATERPLYRIEAGRWIIQKQESTSE